MYSAAVSSELRGEPPATGIYLRLNLKLDAKELLSLRSLVDSVMKSIECCTDFGSLYEVWLFNFYVSTFRNQV